MRTPLRVRAHWCPARHRPAPVPDPGFRVPSPRDAAAAFADLLAEVLDDGEAQLAGARVESPGAVAAWLRDRAEVMRGNRPW